MYTIEIKFKITQKQNIKKQADFIYGLCGMWRMNGQILGRHFPIAKTLEDFKLYVNTPEIDSLCFKYNNIYLSKEFAKLPEIGLEKPAILVIGEEPESLHLCSCEDRNFILYTNYLSLESPLRCFECFNIVPLYKILKTKDGEYYDVICWKSDYEACDSLQMNCKVGEKWATNQLSKLDSQLTKQGLKICKNIKKLTKKEVYYYLYQGTGERLETELKRVCPSCGDKWHQDKALHEIFNFICNRCHLLSNIAWDLK